MRSIGRFGFVALLALACTTQEAQPPPGSIIVSPGSHALVIRISGSGTVQSATPALSCHSDCQLDASGNLTLTAVPDAGGTFAGWQGDCSGTGTCPLTMDADRRVTALFAAPKPPPPPGRFTVTVHLSGSGSGRVTSSPGGIDCPGACAMTMQEGSPVTLTAQAVEGSTFSGWGGACHGAGTCTITASGDAWASFETNTPPPPPPPPPPPSQCAALQPDSSRAPVAVAVGGPNEPGCGPGMGDAAGAIGLQTTDFVHQGSHAILIHIMDGDSGKQKTSTGHNGANGSFGTWLPQPDGFVGYFNSGPSSGPYYFQLEAWNSDGKLQKTTSSMQGNPGVTIAAGGGVIAAGTFTFTPGSPGKTQAALFGPDLSTKWTHDLASKGTVFGIGCDATNRCLVMTDGGPGTISAQWFDANGTAATGEFVILRGFQPGLSTWFETAPWIGGGVAVRRVDQQIDSTGRPWRTAQWLVTVPAGQATSHDAPQWLKDRANTNLALARGGKAYAVLPMGAPDVDCTQKIDVLAPDGTSCGTLDMTVASGRCRTEDVALSFGGTPIQSMPQQLSPKDMCSFRWWKDAVH